MWEPHCGQSDGVGLTPIGSTQTPAEAPRIRSSVFMKFQPCRMHLWRDLTSTARGVRAGTLSGRKGELSPPPEPRLVP